jgi:hypothetical protein
MTSSIPTSLALTNSAYSLPTYSSGVANQNDSFNQASKKPTPVEAKKGKLPSWLAWAVEFIVPTVVIMSFHRLPLRQFSAKTRILLSCSVAGVSTGAIDYWRQKNNDGKVSWPNWMLNTALASTPFELLLGRRK